MVNGNSPADFSDFIYSGPGATPDTTVTPAAPQQAPPLQVPPTPVASNPLPSPAPTATPMSPGTSSGYMPLPQPYEQPANRGGVVKNALTRMFYGMGQGMLHYYGMPTDYDIQKRQFDQALQANDLALKQAQQAFQQQTVDTPLGPMPKQTWEKIGPAVYGGLFGIQKQQMRRQIVPGRGIYDPTLYDPQQGTYGGFIPGTETGAQIDDAMIANFPWLAPAKGQYLTLNQLESASRQKQQLAIQAAPTKTVTSDTLGTTQVSTRQKLLGPTAAGGATAPTGGAGLAAPTPTGGTATPSAAPSTAGTPGAGTFTLPAATAQQNKQTLSDMIAQYRLNPTVMGRLLAKHPDMLAMVQTKNPSWDQALYNAKNKLVTDFYAGPAGNQINASNTALGHLGVLYSAIDALNNGDLKALNGLANSLRLQTGNSAQTVFQTIVHRVAPELAKAYVASGGTGAERGADEKDFDPSLGPTQLKTNVAMSAQLLRSQLNSLENKWNLLPGSLSAEVPFSRFMTPDAQRTLNQLAPQAGGAGGATIRARDEKGVLHEAPAGTALPKGWTLEK